MKQLGERIKRRRDGMQMKLNELAKRVGFSPSALSQIENGKAFPSILTLKTIADCLHTTVGGLIGEHETLTRNPLIKKEQKNFVKKNRSGTKLHLLSHHDPLKQMETYLISFVGKSDTADIMTNHPGQEFCYLIEGKIEFSLNDRTYILSKGDSFYFNSNVPHSAKNLENDGCEMIWVVTPPNI